MKKLKIMDKIRKLFKSDEDPFGSYTGVAKNESDRPEQDADDL